MFKNRIAIFWTVFNYKKQRNNGPFFLVGNGKHCDVDTVQRQKFHESEN